MNEVLAYVAAGFVGLWGLAHAVPTRQVVAGFGPITLDNRRVILQEWLAEAFTMWGLAAAVIAATIFGGAGRSPSRCTGWRRGCCSRPASCEALQSEATTRDIRWKAKNQADTSSRGEAVKKALIIGGAVTGAVLLVRRFAPKMQDIDWEQRINAMPNTAPPKWMFTNIKAIRENSDRILELLKEERGQR